LNKDRLDGMSPKKGIFSSESFETLGMSLVSIAKYMHAKIVSCRDPGKITALQEDAEPPGSSRSRIHERTISSRFLGIILRVLRLEVSV
jgi:hypothetical protein